MKEITMTFTKDELELLYDISSKRVDELSDGGIDDLDKFNKILGLWGKIKHEVEKINTKCKLYDICNCKTGACVALLPDDGCPYYRYFKELIQKNEGK